MLQLHRDNGPAREVDPNELSWPLRLFVILIGYSTVVVPVALMIRYFKRNYSRFEYLSNKLWFKIFTAFAIGTPNYELLPDGEKSSGNGIKIEKRGSKNFLRDLLLLAFFFTGIQTTLVMMGFLQEKIITLGYIKVEDVGEIEKFGDTQFLIFCNRIVALVLAIFVLTVTWASQPPHIPPLHVHSYTSFSNTMSSWCQYEALKYVSFPTQTICKASKVVVTMVMGRIVRGQKYSLFEYICGMVIAFGASIFLLSSSSATSASGQMTTSFSGMILMVGYLMFDAFTLNWQKALFDTRPKVSKYQMMFGVNFFSMILCFVSLLEQNTLRSSINFAMEHYGFTRDVFLLSLSGAVGQLFIYSTIEKFGPIVFAVIMTIRQMLSIVLSAFYYSHPLDLWALAGFFIVFSAIFVDIQKKYFDKRTTR